MTGQSSSPNRNYFYLYYVADLGARRPFAVSRFYRVPRARTRQPQHRQIMIQEPSRTSITGGGGSMTFGKVAFCTSRSDIAATRTMARTSPIMSGRVIRIDVGSRPEKSHAMPKRARALNRELPSIPNDNPLRLGRLAFTDGVIT